MFLTRIPLQLTQESESSDKLHVLHDEYSRWERVQEHISKQKCSVSCLSVSPWVCYSEPVNLPTLGCALISVVGLTPGIDRQILRLGVPFMSHCRHLFSSGDGLFVPLCLAAANTVLCASSPVDHSCPIFSGVTPPVCHYCGTIISVGFFLVFGLFASL